VEKIGKNIFVLGNWSCVLATLLFYNCIDKYISSYNLFGFFVLFYAFVFGLIFKKEKTSWLFTVLLSNVGWIFVLLGKSSLFLKVIYLIILNLFPLLLYIFAFNFLSLTHTNRYKRLMYPIIAMYVGSFILGYLGYNLAALPYLSTLFFIFLTIIFSIRKNNYKYLLGLKKYHILFIISLSIAIIPFVVVYSFPNYFSDDIQYFIVYSFMSIPLFFSYVMWDRGDVVKIDFGISIIFVLLLLFGGLSSTVIFAMLVLEISILEVMILLVFEFILVNLILQFINYNLTKKAALINVKNLSYEFEYIELEYENEIVTVFQLIFQLIEKFCSHTFNSNDVIIISKNRISTSIITQTGAFSGLNIKNFDVMAEFLSDTGPIILNNINCTYKTITISKEQKIYIVIGAEIVGVDKIFSTFETLLQITSKLLEEKNKYSKLPYINYSNIAFTMYSNELAKSQKKLAEYLHDNVLQNVISLVKSAEQISMGDKTTSELIAECRIIIESLRNETFELYPALLDMTLIYQVIQELINRIKTSSEYNGIRILQTGDALLKLPNRLQYPVYRVVKELLQNACKHAKATEILIKLKRIDNFIAIEVEDDGIGISNDEQLAKNKYGLLSIKQTVKQLNGKAIISNKNSGGVNVSITIQLLEEEYYVYLNS